MGCVADDLTDPEDAGLDPRLLRGFDAEVFGDELRLGVAHGLNVFEFRREGFGD